ncbi:MAG: hypothetical protein ACI4P8_05080 [Akkermansia sp.]
MARRKKGRLFGARGDGGGAGRRVLLWLLVLAAGLGLLTLLAWYQMLAFVQGDSFRTLLEAQGRQALGAQRLALESNVTLDGDSLSVEGLQVEDARALRSAHFADIRMEYDRGELLRRGVHVRTLSAEDGELVFEWRRPDLRAAAPKKAAAAVETKPSAPSVAASPGAGMVSMFTPRSYRVDALSCKNTDLCLRRAGQEYRLLNSSATAMPRPQGGWQLQLENGRLHCPWEVLREASLKSALLRRDAQRTELSDARIMLSPGELRLKAQLAENSGRWSANLTLNKASVARLLSESWQQRVSGELFGKMVLNGSAAGISAAEGKLSLQQGVLTDLPFLADVPVEGAYPYRRLELERAECSVRYPYRDAARHVQDAWLFDDLNVRSADGRLLLRGHVLLRADGSLGGTLRVGLPKTVLGALPQQELLGRLFRSSEEEPGYWWLNINLSGTLEAPEEDLSVRVSTLVQALLPAAAAVAPAQLVQQLLQSPSDPPSPAAEAPTEAAAPAAPVQRAAEQLIKAGLRSLF